MSDKLEDRDDLMEYRGYFAEIWYDSLNDAITGHVLNIPKRDLILFAGRSVEELREQFAGSIEDYEAALRKHGRTPEPVG